MTDEEVQIAKSAIEDAVAPLMARLEQSDREIKGAIVSIVAQLDQLHAAARPRTAAPIVDGGLGLVAPEELEEP